MARLLFAEQFARAAHVEIARTDGKSRAQLIQRLEGLHLLLGSARQFSGRIEQKISEAAPRAASDATPS